MMDQSTDRISAAAPSLRIFRSKELRTRRALADIVAGLRLWRLWLMLGWLDIRQRYQRSMIGPLWITISMAIMIGTLGFLYASLFGIDIHEFVPFVAAGFCVWFLISATITDGTLLFIQSESIIRNTNLPLGLHVFRLLWRNVIIFAHNIAVMIGVYLFFQINPGLNLALALPGLLVVLINLGAISLVLGAACVRFRDAPPIIVTLLQIAFFLTPILYLPNLLGTKLRIFADWNPFYHLIDIVRAPLLGKVPEGETYFALFLITGVNCTTAIVFYGRFRSRIAYWL
jgi:ABC-2 type transport system permease protein/lipopolysaccharide transport system permease protein